MAEMRLFANIIVAVRTYTLQDLTGEDILDRKHFESLSKAICSMTKNEITGTLKAGQKLRIGYLLKKAIKVMKGYYIMHGKDEKMKEVENFAAVLDLNRDYIFYIAQLTCELRRGDLRKPQAMPDEEV